MTPDPIVRVLVADDEQSSQVVAQWALRQGADMGCELEVVLVSQGDEAAEAVESGCAEGRPFAVVLLDYLMPPGPDGRETAQRIRQVDQDALIVIITARSEIDPRAIAAEVGPADRLFFLRKPVHPEEVRQLCVALANRWRAEREVAQARRSLEQQVEERTRELREANERLCREVLERRAAERDLMIARSSLEHAPDAILWAAEDGRLTFANAFACDWLGYTCQELLARHVWEIDPTFDPGSWALNFAALRASGSDSVETVLRRKDGSVLPAEVSAVGLEYEGRAQVMAFIRDTTRRRLAEAERERFRAALTESEEMVAVLSPDQRIQFANPACEHVTGYTSEELIGRAPPFLREGAVDEDTRRGVAEALSHSGHWAGRIAARRKDGTPLDLDITATAVGDASEQPTGYVFVGHEVNEIRDLQRRLRRSQRLEAIGTLAGGMAHDLNNMLAAIQGYTELTLTGLPGDSRGAEYLGRGLQAVRRARDLVAQVLSFARSEDDARRPLEVHLVVNEATKLLRAILPATVEIRSRIDEESGAVLADPGLVHQILLNLCTNAYQAMPNGKGTLQITLDAIPGEGEEAGWVRLIVQDDGTGMAPGIQSRVFEPFFTTRADSGGSGMGLATVHSIVISHGGRISLRSAPGEGAALTVLLPRQDAGAPYGEPDLPAAVGDGIRVLVVDDEPMLLSVIHEGLELCGYVVSAFADPRDALAAFDASPEAFDAVITDVMMPHVTGEELARHILTARPDLPVVLLSGSGDRISRDEALEMGCAEYILKPVGPRLLSRTLTEAVRPKHSPDGAGEEETCP